MQQEQHLGKLPRQRSPRELAGTWQQPRMKSRLVLLGFVCLASAGCTTVRIVDATGGTSIRRSFGFVRIIANPRQSVVSAEVTSLGYASTPVGSAVGFTKESLILTDGKCRLVFVVRTPEQATQARELLETVKPNCLESERD